MKVSRTDTALMGLNHVESENLVVFRVASSDTELCNGSAALHWASSCSGLAVWKWRVGQWWRVCDCFRMAGGVWLLHRMLGGTMMLLEMCQ